MRRFRILSIDGGGMRGIAPARWLHSLCAQIGHKPLHASFDLVAGTSTGAIIALAIGCGIPAETILRLYRDRGLEIFPPRPASFLGRYFRFFRHDLWDPKYSADGINKVLQEVFGAKRLGQLKTRVLVMSYDTFTRQPYPIKSWDPDFKDLPVWEAARASSAAPTFFPAHVLNIGSVLHPLVDGGVVANNPAACAMAEAYRLKDPGQPVFLASLGTGRAAKPIPAHAVLSMGAIEWAPVILDVLMDASEAVHYQMRQALEPINFSITPESNLYVRMQHILAPQYEAMDNGNPDHLRELDALAANYLAFDGALGFRRIVKELS